MRLAKATVFESISLLLLLAGTLTFAIYGISTPEMQVPPAVYASRTLDLANFDFGRAKKTVIVTVQDGCNYCEMSLPFYAQLNQLISAHPQDQMIALVRAGSTQVKSQLEHRGINALNVSNEWLDSVGIIGTPTLMIVNSTGRIEHTWVGRLSSHGESEVKGNL